MSAAHTPGPWFGGNLRTHCATASHNGVDIGAENGSNVAIVLHQEFDREPAETIANARLIAAAPELLESLQAAYSLLCRMDAPMVDPDLWKSIRRTILNAGGAA